MVKELKGYMNEFGYSESFVIDDKNLYCFPGGSATNIAALDRITGKTTWSAKVQGDTTHFCSPVLVNLPARQMYVSVSRHWLFAVDCKNGELLWKFPVAFKYDGDHVNTPVYDAPYLYWVSGDENGSGTIKLEISADGKSVKEIWKNPAVRNSMGGIILHDKKLFVTTENKNLNMMDTNTGQVISKTKSPYGGLIFADNKFFVYGNNGDLSQFNYEAGKLTPGGTFKIEKGSKEHFSHPVIANGVLYVRHGKALMAYLVK
jgi:outer membrane protein assembly factor BamB